MSKPGGFSWSYGSLNDETYDGMGCVDEMGWGRSEGKLMGLRGEIAIYPLLDSNAFFQCHS